MSSEGAISKELEKYAMKIPKKKIHHVLYFARLLVTDTQTMATEAAILGTPTIRSNKFVDPKKEMGNFIELENRGLLINERDPKKAIEKAEILAEDKKAKKEWKEKKEKLIREKIDITEFMAWLMENYPESLEKFKKSPEIQYRFR